MICVRVGDDAEVQDTKALCALCHTVRPLKKDGTFRAHWHYPWDGMFTSKVTRCLGNGLTPSAVAALANKQNKREEL